MEKADSIIERYLSLTILFENAAPPHSFIRGVTSNVASLTRIQGNSAKIAVRAPGKATMAPLCSLVNAAIRRRKRSLHCGISIRQRLFAFKLRRWEYTADGLRGSSPRYPASESSLQCLGKSGP